MAITIVQSAIGGSNPFSTGLTVTAGNLLIVAHAGFGDGTSSIADNLSTVFTLAGEGHNTTGYGGRPSDCFMWYGVATSSGAWTITQTGTFPVQSSDGMNGGGQLMVMEVSGCDPITPVSQPTAQDSGCVFSMAGIAGSVYVAAAAEVFFNLGAWGGYGGTTVDQYKTVMCALGHNTNGTFGFTVVNTPPTCSVGIQLNPYYPPVTGIESYINNYTLAVGAGGINSVATSLPVSLGASVSSGFRILVDSELMLVTGGGTTTTWTVTRQVESTIATAHSSGTAIYIVMTAAGLSNLFSQNSGKNTLLSANVPSSNPSSPNYGTFFIGTAGTNQVPTMTSNTTPSGVAYASSNYGSCPPWQAFVQPVGTYSGWITSGTSTGYIGYQFPSPTTIISYSIVPWSSDTFPSRSFKTWTLQGSNDSGSTYTTLDSRDYSNYANGGYFWIQWRPYRFCVPLQNIGSYSWYRINVTANWGDGYCGCGNLAFEGTMYSGQPCLYVVDFLGNVKQCTLGW